MARSARDGSAGATRGDLLDRLEGRDCIHCEDGSLERTVYKDNAAAVCDECGTPRVQLWKSVRGSQRE